MAITDPLILPPDVLLVPVNELPEDVRRQLAWEEGDYAVTRPRSRTPSRIIDAGAAELLEQFRAPITIVDAVIRFSRGRSLNPETTLEEAYPLLERLLASGFLVAEGSDGAQAIEQSLRPGDEIAGFEVLECVQGLDDTELYQVRSATGTAALKIERPVAAGRAAGDFAREAAILDHLAGRGIAPRLLARGEIDGRHYLAVEWCSGVDGYIASAELRRKEDRAGLLFLSRAIVDAYVRLHERGVFHGDVHPRNVLVSASGEVHLIDFGIARWGGSPETHPGRAGVAFYFEPEYAAPVRAGKVPPDASAAGEQYGLGALLYYLIAGAHYRDFPLEKDRMLRHIEEEPPLPFAERGVRPWPELEAILERALAKSPQERFASLAAMAEALAAVEPPSAATPKPGGTTASEALLARVLDRLRPDGALFREGFPDPPRLSINYGAAGAACALYRIALAREDAELLSLADLWAVKAVAGGVSDEGFYNPGKQLDRETLGAVTPYHTPSGPFAIQALVAHALGDPGVQRRAVSGFLEAVKKPCLNPDLTLGRSGVLLAVSMLLETMADDDLAKSLRELGEGLLGELWREIGEQPPIPRAAGEWANLGMAHGWAGYLYATLRWCRSAKSPRPEGLQERLSELAGCERSWGRGLRWPWLDGGGTSASMPGWCNGSAGFVPLWTLAHRELGGPDWLTLAEGAAWNAWEAPDRNASLCCGLAGRAYALLDLWQHGGGDAWLERARDLAESASLEIARFSEAADSLYKGEPGVAALVADLANPEAAAQPFFGDEGW